MGGIGGLRYRLARRWLAAVGIAAATLVSSSALAADCSADDKPCIDSEAGAQKAMASLDAGRVHELWDNSVSALWKSKTTEEVFVASFVGAIPLLSSGVATRVLVQQGLVLDAPTNTQYYNRLYVVTLKNGLKLYENIAMQKEGATYKVSGLGLFPYPTS